MSRLFIGLLVVLFSSTAFGAKAHREAKKELTPKIKEAAKSLKAACGVAPKVSGDWKALGKIKVDKVGDVKRNMEYELRNVVDMSKKFCSDADSKALFKKNVKKIIISAQAGSDAETTFERNTFTIKTSFQANSGGYKFQSIMDEW